MSRIARLNDDRYFFQKKDEFQSQIAKIEAGVRRMFAILEEDEGLWQIQFGQLT
ncbi:hypothetical protein IQ250_26805 [Pseudanabaenaceae cyanobacterium LEGE 13415]|nr:hypothetical protein [Pseudanabaenaceae cyanobacterium LEGE 13415]